MDQGTFRQKIEQALGHVRDIVLLRVMDLGPFLLSELPRDQMGWALSQYLLRAIEELRPSQADSNEWAQRRYELLTLRYVNGMSPEQVAERMAMSRRHYYRLWPRALDEFAEYVWAARFGRERMPAEPRPEPGGVDDDLAPLQREVASLSAAETRASLADSVESVLQILQPLARRGGVSLAVTLPPGLPAVEMNPALLKQFLLVVTSDLLCTAQVRRVELAARTRGRQVVLQIRAQAAPGAEQSPLSQLETADRASTRLALAAGASLRWSEAQDGGLDCLIELPADPQRQVLIVDDNEDVLTLFARYLASGGYRPLLAQTGTEAISVATSRKLYAITLDLMMSGEDGWDVLMTLRGDSRARHVPIIVCSVLDHENLALMLGATGFLKKPVMREPLLQALHGLGLESESATGPRR